MTMHKRKKISICSWLLVGVMLLLFVLLPAFSQARQWSEEEVRTAVQTWVRHVTADARPDAVVDRMEAYVVDGETVGYVAHLEGGGFCLCSANDLVLPVYLYNPKGTYDPKIPGYQFILEEIAGRTADMTNRVHRKDPTLMQLRYSLEERSNFWQDLVYGQVPQRTEDLEANEAGPTIMELDFTAKWHQGTPYNDQCPVLTPSSDERCVVGCNATAAAQVMYYWKWPNTGVGTGQTTYNFRYRTDWDSEPLSLNPGIPSDWAGGNRLKWQLLIYSGGFLKMFGFWDWSLLNGAKNDKNITYYDNPQYQAALDSLYNRLTPWSNVFIVNCGATTYDWSLMKDTHSDPVDAGDAEVAKLCYHVGVASESTYGWWATGSCFSHPDPAHGDISRALDYNFRYDGDIYVYSARNLATMYYMAEEIQWLRPVLLGGSNAEGGGHAYVVYGYNTGTDPNREFLMNMGWGPDHSYMWYSLDSTPFPLKQDHTVRIAPENVVKFVGAANPGDGSPNNPYQNVEQAIVLAADNTKLIFKAGSYNSYSGDSLVIDRPFTLSGYDTVIGK